MEQQTTFDIKASSLNDLKAVAYDLTKQITLYQTGLRQVEQEIELRLQREKEEQALKNKGGTDTGPR